MLFFPLGLLGLAFLAYLLIAASARAMSFAVGVLGGCAAHSADLSIGVSALVGLASFIGAEAVLAYAAARWPRGPVRALLLLLVIAPAVIAGSSVGALLGTWGGIAHLRPDIMAALLCMALSVGAVRGAGR